MGGTGGGDGTGVGGTGGTGGVGGTGGGAGGRGGTGGALPEPPGLIAFWRFNEATGTTVADSSGNGQSLTLSSSSRWTTLGHEGAAFAFDGASDVAGRDAAAEASRSASYPTIPLTFSAWIRPDAAAIARPFATAVARTHEDYAFQNFWLGLISGKPACTIHSPSMEGAVASVVVPPAAWTHIACTYGLEATPGSTSTASRRRRATTDQVARAHPDARSWSAPPRRPTCSDLFPGRDRRRPHLQHHAHGGADHRHRSQ